MRAFDRDLIRGGIVASGHGYRANGPNTWLLRSDAAKWRFSLPTWSRPHMAHRWAFA